MSETRLKFFESHIDTVCNILKLFHIVPWYFCLYKILSTVLSVFSSCRSHIQTSIIKRKSILQFWNETSLTLHEISASLLSYEVIATVFKYFKCLKCKGY